MDASDQWKIHGGIYHVMNRGNRKSRIFEDDRDRKRFTRLLIESKRKHRVEILAGSQMGTHFHLGLCTPDGNLSDFMRDLQGEFARYSNWRHGRVGHLFQGRFRRVLIQNDLHLFIATSYIFNNPVLAGYVSRPESWKWSTYAATVGLAPLPEYLSISWVETLFPASSLAASRTLLKRCIDDPQRIVAYVEAVDPTTAAAIRSYVAERRQLEQPCAYGTLVRPSLEQLFAGVKSRPDRITAIRLARETHRYKIAEIACCLGMHPTAVSKMYCSCQRGPR